MRPDRTSPCLPVHRRIGGTTKHACTTRRPILPGCGRCLKLSKAEAGRLGHDYIGPEHYLLGIIRKGDGLAVQTLNNLDLDLEELKLELERMLEVGKGPNVNLFSPNAEAKKVLDMTKEIARQMKHNWIGTEHLLLAFIREEDFNPGEMPEQLRCGRRHSPEGGAGCHRRHQLRRQGFVRGGCAQAMPEGLPFHPTHAYLSRGQRRLTPRAHGFRDPPSSTILIAILRARQGVGLGGASNAWSQIRSRLIAELEHRLQTARDADRQTLLSPVETEHILCAELGRSRPR